MIRKSVQRFSERSCANKNLREFRSLFDLVNILLTPFPLFTLAGTCRPQLGRTTPPLFIGRALARGTTGDMLAYRITEIDSRIVVGTEQEPILICTSLDMARQVVADALAPATKPLKPRARQSAPETSPASPVEESATR